MKEPIVLESKLGLKIKHRLPPTIHWQSMTGAMMSNGTPDKYLDGVHRDLWMELKQFDSMPRSGVVCCAPVPDKKKQPKGHLSHLQLRWLKRRHANGGNAIVVAGLPNGKAVLMVEPEAWECGVPVEHAETIEEIATWITKFCSG
jgi:hypothetical protein